MTVSHGRSTFLGKTIFSETFFCREDYRPRPLSGLGPALIPRTVKRVRYYNIIFFFFTFISTAIRYGKGAPRQKWSLFLRSSDIIGFRKKRVVIRYAFVSNINSNNNCYHVRFERGPYAKIKNVARA